MGCWNETDMVSQLSILGGDKVRMFVLRGDKPPISEDAFGYCNINDLWEPIGCVLGEYNDYGGITNAVKDINYHVLLQQINDYCNKEFNSVEDFLNEVRIADPKLEFKKFDKPYHIGLCFVLEEMFQSMVSNNPRHRGELRSTLLYNNIAKWYSDFSTEQSKRWYFGDRLTDRLYTNSGRYEVPIPAYMFELKSRFISKNIELESSDAAQAIVNEIVKLQMFEYSLLESRKGWMPQFGMGSQDGNWPNEMRIYKTTIQTMHKIIARRKKQYIQENT